VNVHKKGADHYFYADLVKPRSHALPDEAEKQPHPHQTSVSLTFTSIKGYFVILLAK